MMTTVAILTITASGTEANTAYDRFVNARLPGRVLSGTVAKVMANAIAKQQQKFILFLQ